AAAGHRLGGRDSTIVPTPFFLPRGASVALVYSMSALSILARDLSAIVGVRHVREARAERMTYAMDGLPTHRRIPDIVVLPGSREELIAVVRLLAALGVPFVPRGAGTGLSGGALADEGSVLLVLTRLNPILKIDQ